MSSQSDRAETATHAVAVEIVAMTNDRAVTDPATAEIARDSVVEIATAVLRSETEMIVRRATAQAVTGLSIEKADSTEIVPPMEIDLAETGRSTAKADSTEIVPPTVIDQAVTVRSIEIEILVEIDPRSIEIVPPMVIDQAAIDPSIAKAAALTGIETLEATGLRSTEIVLPTVIDRAEIAPMVTDLEVTDRLTAKAAADSTEIETSVETGPRSIGKVGSTGIVPPTEIAQAEIVLLTAKAVVDSIEIETLAETAPRSTGIVPPTVIDPAEIVLTATARAATDRSTAKAVVVSTEIEASVATGLRSIAKVGSTVIVLPMETDLAATAPTVIDQVETVRSTAKAVADSTETEVSVVTIDRRSRSRPGMTLLSVSQTGHLADFQAQTGHPGLPFKKAAQKGKKMVAHLGP